MGQDPAGMAVVPGKTIVAAGLTVDYLAGNGMRGGLG